MGFLLKQLFGLIKLLNSDTGHNQIAAGIAAGFVLGMSPWLSLQALLIFFCLFFFRVQAGMAFLAAFFFAFVAWLLDPMFHAFGRVMLEAGALQGLWTTLYNLPLVPFTRFNNTTVIGAGVISLALCPLIFFVARSLVLSYRQAVVERFRQTKFWRAVKATSFYRWYYTYDNLYGN